MRALKLFHMSSSVFAVQDTWWFGIFAEAFRASGQTLFQESNRSRTATSKWVPFLKTVTQRPKMVVWFVWVLLILCKYSM